MRAARLRYRAVRDRLLRPALGRAAATRAIRFAGRAGVAHARPFAYPALLQRLAAGCPSVLDVGTGTMAKLASLPCGVKLGLEAHRPYLERGVSGGVVGINARASDLSKLFVPGAVALVTMLDFIEHLERTDAVDVLHQAEAVASRRVILFTPRGWFPQDDYDALGLGGEELQRHRSGWDVGDFRELGYSVVVLRGYHDERNLAFAEAFGHDAPPVDALVAWKDLSPA